MLGTDYPVMWHNIPEEQIPELECSINLITRENKVCGGT